MFLDENPLQIKGDVVFSAPVSITNELISTSGKVNDFVLENELVQPEKIHNGTYVHYNIEFRKIAMVVPVFRCA